MMWIKRKEGCHQIIDLWDNFNSKSYNKKIVASIQIFNDGSCGFWFITNEKAILAKNLDGAKRLVFQKLQIK